MVVSARDVVDGMSFQLGKCSDVMLHYLWQNRAIVFFQTFCSGKMWNFENYHRVQNYSSTVATSFTCGY